MLFSSSSPGRQVLDVEGEFLGSRGVHRVGQQAMVGAHLTRPDPEVGVLGCQRILIEQDLLGRFGAVVPAAQNGILSAGFGPGVVEVLVHPLGNREIGLLDPPPHLLVEPLLQRLGGAHDGGGVAVLRLEVRHDRGIAAVPEPGVVVESGLAVNGVGSRYHPGDGRTRSFAGRECRALEYPGSPGKSRREAAERRRYERGWRTFRVYLSSRRLDVHRPGSGDHRRSWR